jgi:hypothetical protein
MAALMDARASLNARTVPAGTSNRSCSDNSPSSGALVGLTRQPYDTVLPSSSTTLPECGKIRPGDRNYVTRCKLNLNAPWNYVRLCSLCASSIESSVGTTGAVREGNGALLASKERSNGNSYDLSLAIGCTALSLGSANDAKLRSMISFKPLRCSFRFSSSSL